MEIRSNGSKWAGEPPDTLDILLERLTKHTLDPTFEEYGNFIHEEDDDAFLAQCPEYRGTWHAFGNFFDYSHVFNIRGTRDELAQLRTAIRANQATDRYAAAKVAIEARKEERRAYEAAQREKWERR